jgi:c-di-GMP phosphodiesterase
MRTIDPYRKRIRFSLIPFSVGIVQIERIRLARDQHDDQMNDIPLTLARQPIMTKDGRVLGYELLYRGSAIGDSTAATVKSARVLCEALSTPGLDGLTGDAHMFVNFGQALLTTDVPLLLPAGRGVVEIIEDVEPTRTILETLDKIRRAGVGIALDDFQFQKPLIPLLAYANFVKVDILQSAHELDELVERLKTYQVPMIAEKVETHEQLQRCWDLGFHLFQGYFFARPEPMQAKSIASSQMTLVSLIMDLQNPDLEAEELAQVIGRDLGLTHRILKLSNSAAYRRQRPVASIADAVVLLGRDTVSQWASLLVMTQLAERKPLELFALALIRGRLCQVLGEASHQFAPGELYTVGLLSVLDALLDRPMKTLVNELPLAVSLRDALCGISSPLRDILQKAIAYETANWGALGELTVDEEARLAAAYAGAARFSGLALGQ